MRVHVLLVHHEGTAVVYGVYSSIELATEALATKEAAKAQGAHEWFSVTSVTVDM